MNANEVLIDLLKDNRRRLKRALDAIPDECLSWHPEPDANSIATTIWHMARILDVFLHLQALGKPVEAQCWYIHGWAAGIGYDPHGAGQNGWGMLTGYTPEETAAIPTLSREEMVRFLDQVYDTVQDYLSVTPEADLFLPAPGFDGKYSRYQCIQMALMDNVRHLGEIYAIKASWERR